MKISRRQARRLAIQAQGLDGRWRLPKGKEGAAQAVERLGYVQIDTIHVVERAHHHTLWARCPDYTPAMLHELQAVDRRVFEYWANAASYVPMTDYRYYEPRMRAAAKRHSAWYLSDEGRKLRDHVRQRIRQLRAYVGHARESRTLRSSLEKGIKPRGRPHSAWNTVIAQRIQKGGIASSLSRKASQPRLRSRKL